MRSADIVRLLQQRPFGRFRFYVLETNVYEIQHPDQVAVGRSTITLSSPANQPGIEDVIIALVHITRIEVLSSTATPSSN